jgi:hypothetical protein
MLRVDAGRVITVVANEQPVRNLLLIPELPGETMRAYTDAVPHSDPPIA